MVPLGEGMQPFQSARVLAAVLGDPAALPVDAGQRTELFNLAVQEGLGPLLAKTIRPFVFDEDRRRCDAILGKSWIWHDRMLSSATSVAGALEAGGVKALSLKGPVLALRHFKPPFVRRPSGDLDIGVAAGDLERACAALASLGYVLEGSLAAYMSTTHHAALVPPQSGGLPSIDLHFRLTQGTLGVPIANLLEAAIPFELPGGVGTWVQDPADELMHLGLHAVYGRFCPLFHLFEFHRLWRAAEPAVRERAVSRAREFHLVGGLRMLDVAFHCIWNEPLLNNGMALPRTWLDSRIDDRLLRDFESWKVATEAEGGHGGSFGSRIQGRWLDFQLTDRPIDALRLCWSLCQLIIVRLKRDVK